MLNSKAEPPGVQSMTRAVILIGFMGAGKSTVGRALAEQLGWTFEDLDERIERREQRKVPEIFRESGEAEFRRAEHAALRELLPELRSGAERIVALGGGAFVEKRNARLLEAAGVPRSYALIPETPAEERELQNVLAQQGLREGISFIRNDINGLLLFPPQLTWDDHGAISIT